MLGFIRKIYKIKTNYYSLIQIFEKSKSFSTDDFLEARLNEFFLISNLTKNFAFINLENVKHKCVYLNNNNEYHISIIYDEEDHD